MLRGGGWTAATTTVEVVLLQFEQQKANGRLSSNRTEETFKQQLVEN